MFQVGQTLKRRLSNLFLSLILVASQAGFALAPFISAPKVAAAEVCVVDTAGPNDEPGQKDLNQLCVDDAAVSSIDVDWNWDETGTNGANTLDGCALFDTDNDGNINYSVCVTTTGDPAVEQSTTLYSCGDAKVDRCTSTVTPLTITNGTNCSVTSPSNDDPFPGPPNPDRGDDYPADTKATCTLVLADVGGADAELVDVCSYPSAQPNSDPSDCVIIQDSSGKLEVIKNLEPADNAGLFNLQVDGVTEAANVGDGGTTGEVVVDQGNHDIGETAGTNTSLAAYSTSIECRDLNGTGGLIASGSAVTLADVPVADGADVVCTITNTAAGSITIVKNAIPNDAQDFAFTVTGNGVSNFSLDDDSGVSGSDATLSNTQAFNNLSAGTYTFDEASVAGWYLDGIDCPNISETQNVEDGTVSLTITAGQNVTCTFTNRKLGQIVVSKQTQPDNDSTQFSISASPSSGVVGSASQTIADDETETYVVKHGTYGVTETVPAGWTMTSNNCSNLVIDGNTPQVNGIPTRTCTIENTKLAKLKIIKDALPNDGQDFAFTVVNLPGGGFSLDDDSDNDLRNEKQYVDLLPGSYSVTEQSTPGWALTGLVCDGNPVEGSTAAVTLAAGQDTTCTFTNTKLVSISGTKYTANADSSLGPVLSGWTIFIDSNNNGQLDGGELSDVTDQNGDYSFTNILYETTVSLREVLVAGWTQIFGDYDFTVDSANDVTDLDFGNFENGSISGFKWNDKNANDVLDGDEGKLDGWTITLYNDQDTVLDTDVTDGSGNYSFTNLAPGTYSVCETQQAGWVQTFPDGNACHDIVVDVSGETNQANFGNQGRGGIQVVKDVDHDGDGQVDEFGATDWSWDIDGSGDFATGSTQDVAAGTYDVSEDQKDDYHVTDLTCDNQSLGAVETTEITVGPGQTVVCTFTNTRDTGTVEVKKEIEPADDTGLFDLQIGGATELEDASDGDTTGAVQVVTGSYDVSEIAGDSTDLADYSSSLTCTKNGQALFTDVSTTDSAVFEVAKDDVVVCTFTNVRYGHIIVKKQTLPNGSEQSFSFTADYDQDGFSLSDGQQNDSGNLLPGDYSVSETVPTGWDLDSATCDDQSDPSSIELSAGETVTCTFTNIERGNISGTKYEVGADATDGTGATQLAGWTIFIDANDNGELDLGEVTDTTDILGAYSFTSLVPGDYVICEVLESGWTQIFPASCHDVTVDPGEPDSGNDFGNFENGSISGYKFEDQNGDGFHDDGEPRLEGWQIFIDENGNKEYDNGEPTTSTDSNGDYSFTNLTPGTYEVCEELQDDWVQTTIPVCHTVVINLSGETNPNMKFGNQGQGTITVIKEVVSSEEDHGLFNLRINEVTEAENVGDNGTTGAVTLPVGTYSVDETAGTETNLDNYDTTYECVENQESIIASGEGTTVPDFTLGLGDDVVCTFTNTRHGEIIVIKDAVPNDAQDFHFTIEELEKEFDLDDDNDDELSNSETTEVSSGNYTITEGSVEGWDLADIDCDDSEVYDLLYNYESEDDGEIFVAPGQTVICVFTNEKRAEIVVTKYNDYDRDGEKDENEPTLPGWDFTLAGGECEAHIFIFTITVDCDDFICSLPIISCEPSSTTQTTGEDGTTTFENVKPKEEYELSETLQEGWTLSNIECDGDEEQYIGRPSEEEDTYTVYPQPGETIECFVGNYTQPTLQLQKTNNKPEPTVAGDVVTYMLTVTNNSEAPVYDTKVNDLPPENFAFISGSETASNGGSLTTTYASPGQWSLGDLFPGDVVTLTYQAVIGSNVTAGNYPDLAFAEGLDEPEGEGRVLSNQTIAGEGTPFVGTDVTIKGEVLGAVLVNTGNRWMALQFIVPLIVVIIVTSLDARQKKGAKV